MVDAPGRITLWGVEVFAAAAEERSISAAARRLGASPSAISQQLSNLETALGTQLVDRSARPLALTPAGGVFLLRAQTILNEAAEARAELAMNDLSRLSRFNLGMIEDFDADVTPQLLAEMGDTLSGTRFLLETGASHRLYDLLETRVLDVIVAAETAAVGSWAEVHPLLEEPFIAAVPKGAVDGSNDPLTTLRPMPLIRYTKRHLMGRQIAAHLARQNLTLDHRFELDSYHAILSMVASGAGWSIMTPLGYLRAERFRDKVDVIALPMAPMSRTISLIARRGVLHEMPGQVADRLRPLLTDLIVGPAKERMPWLGDGLRVL